jgi:hypothetical protein
MSEYEFENAIHELRGEFTAPSRVVEITAMLLERLFADNQRLKDEIAGVRRSVPPAGY